MSDPCYGSSLDDLSNGTIIIEHPAASSGDPSTDLQHSVYDDGDMQVYSTNINDPIHNYIEIDGMVQRFIDTVQFQRLRGLHQLGMVYLVYPGASHRRFEHSIGELVTKFRTKQPELDISLEDVESVKLAGLCHDLGHGPFSHLFDRTFIPRTRKDIKWSHEDGSSMMLDYLIEDNGIEISTDQVNLIKDLIQGEDPSSTRSRPKGFLFDIVANKRNGVDVDKFDYIQRDCYNIGFEKGHNIERLMKFSRVIDNQICYNQKEAINLYHMFHKRYSLFKSSYYHPVVKSIDLMVSDALFLADPVLEISKKIDDPSEYLHLNDSILSEIAKSKDIELKPARDLVNRIYSRRLYKFVDQMPIPSHLSHILNKGTVREDMVARCYQPTLDNPTLRGEDIILDWCTIDYGMGEKNPVDSVRFYSKNYPHRAEAINRNLVSSMIPSQFTETTLRLFSRDPSKRRTVQAAFRKFLSQFDLHPSTLNIIPNESSHTLPNKRLRTQSSLGLPRYNSSF